jgi:hypothetical protein
MELKNQVNSNHRVEGTDDFVSMGAFCSCVKLVGCHWSGLMPALLFPKGC